MYQLSRPQCRIHKILQNKIFLIVIYVYREGFKIMTNWVENIRDIYQDIIREYIYTTCIRKPFVHRSKFSLEMIKWTTKSRNHTCPKVPKILAKSLSLAQNYASIITPIRPMSNSFDSICLPLCPFFIVSLQLNMSSRICTNFSFTELFQHWTRSYLRPNCFNIELY